MRQKNTEIYLKKKKEDMKEIDSILCQKKKKKKLKKIKKLNKKF